MNNNVVRELKKLDINDFIWFIYFFIVIFSLIADYFQRKYLLYKNKNYQNISKNLTLILLIVAFLIYLYFVIDSLEDINYLRNSQNSDKKRVAMERLITTLVFLVGGALAIYAEIDDRGGNIDLAIL